MHELHAALKRACADDPTLSAVAPGCSAHCHGWGYVIHADNGLFHHRTARSIYQDKTALPKLEGRIRAIFHGRYASKPELAGHIFSHPFVAADDTRTIYFAHNGGIEVPGLPERKVDSEWALEQIIALGGIEPALPLLKEHTKSALNLLVLTIGRQKETPALLNYFHYFRFRRNPKRPNTTKCSRAPCPADGPWSHPPSRCPVPNLRIWQIFNRRFLTNSSVWTRNWVRQRRGRGGMA